MHWTLIRRARPPWLVLGDTPVTLFSEQAGPFRSVGFATEGVEVHMPVSPAVAFIATATDHPLAERVIEFADVETADGMNAETWANALIAVFGHSTEAIDAAREATPESAREYREPVAHIGGGPAEWERYKPRQSTLADED